MRTYVSILLLFLSFISVSCSHKSKNIPRSIASLSRNDQLEGIWFLQGTSSVRGPYNGEIEFRKKQNGTYSVIRIATYINNFYEGLKVQEVWVGEAVADNDSIVVVYELKSADFITRLNNLKRQVSDFRSPKEVVSRFIVKTEGLTTEYSDKKSSIYKEWITTRRDLDANPLWAEQKYTLPVKSDRFNTADLRELKSAQAEAGYLQDPLAKSFLAKRSQPKIEIDESDYQFYKENKDVLRVVNKITDVIAVAEDVQKRNAYSPSLYEKARGFDKRTVEIHLNKYGIISNAVLDRNGNLQAYVYSPDSAFLTGQYLASQSMRYGVEQSEQALENIRKSLRGVSVLFNVTGPKKRLARTLASYSVNETVTPDWFLGQVEQDQLLWKESEDITSSRAVLNGLLWTYTTIGRESPEGKAAQELMRQMLESNTSVLRNEDRQLIRYVLGYRESERDLLKNSPSSKNIWYYQGAAPWKKLHAHLLHYQNILLASDLKKSKDLKDWAEMQLKHMAQKFSHPRMGDLMLTYKMSARDASIDERDMLINLRETPYPKPNLNVSIDHSYNSDWELSSVPRNFRQKIELNEPVDYYYQGAISYPLYKAVAYSDNAGLQSPFTHSTTQSEGTEINGVDYLYTYWLARHVSAIGEEK